MDFINGEMDVLVSTTIIETGLDISNVNTMIIHDADNLGLSQLVSAARTCRTFQPDGVCIPDVPQKQDAERSGRETSVRHPGIYRSGKRFQDRHAGSGDPGRRKSVGRAAAWSYGSGRL